MNPKLLEEAFAIKPRHVVCNEENPAPGEVVVGTLGTYPFLQRLYVYLGRNRKKLLTLEKKLRRETRRSAQSHGQHASKSGTGGRKPTAKNGDVKSGREIAALLHDTELARSEFESVYAVFWSMVRHEFAKELVGRDKLGLRGRDFTVVYVEEVAAPKHPEIVLVFGEKLTPKMAWAELEKTFSGKPG